ASFLKTMEGHLIEKHISIGTIDLVAARLIASRVPDQVVNERRRAAKKRAKKKGYTPSKTHLELLAWNLFITNVPSAIWSSITVVKAYPIRWQIELIFKSWKSYCHLATINAKKADTVLLKRCTRSLSKPRSYEETMRCRFDPALEPMP